MDKETENKDFPLYPRLSEAGEIEATELVEAFKQNLIKAADEAIGKLYCDIMPHIESDSWTNYRNVLMDGLSNYNNRKLQAPYDFKKIRQKIYEEYREEIIPDLNQDLLEEIESLKRQLEWERKINRV